jgi:cytochrome c oxidase subunit 2
MKIFPKNVSTYGAEIDFIFWLITGVAAIAAVIVIFLILYPLLTRKKNLSPEERYLKGDNFKQLKFVYIAIALMAIADFTFLILEGPTWTKIEQTLPEKDFHVAIIGRQWMWEVVYPGPDGKLYTADDVKQINKMYIPVNAVVHMDIQAYDVIHSVFIPHARFKQDALPGRNITRWVKIKETGTYPMTCAEICGIGHANMKGDIIVQSREDFEKTLAKLYKK